MRLIAPALISILFASGCAFLPTRTVILGGVDDVVNIPKGIKVCGVALPTDEAGKTYCIVTSKASRLTSLDAMTTIEKECK